MRRWSFAKGHGTENDFVLLTDRESLLRVGPAEVRAICDRHAGIGGDGLIRAVNARYVSEWDGEDDLWFMDYRNADGSVAELCGNGVRVFARFLLEESMAFGPSFSIATRAGVRQVEVLPDTRIRVEMGPVTVTGGGVRVTTADGSQHPAVSVDVGNPHAVCFVDDVTAVDLHVAPAWDPAGAYPEGVNVEFVQPVDVRHLAMRVYERGSGETRSCGTGTVAAAAAAHARSGAAWSATYRVDVPGGSVEVELGKQTTYLTGPAVVVARGQLVLPDATEEG